MKERELKPNLRAGIVRLTIILSSNAQADPRLLIGTEKQTDDQNDPSNQIWSVYMSEAALRDKGLVESWKSDMDGTLIFVCFLSWLK